jgi:uncharacterized protein YlxW (UPF0749 family)
MNMQDLVRQQLAAATDQEAERSQQEKQLHTQLRAIAQLLADVGQVKIEGRKLVVTLHDQEVSVCPEGRLRPIVSVVPQGDGYLVITGFEEALFSAPTIEEMRQQVAQQIARAIAQA